MTGRHLRPVDEVPWVIHLHEMPDGDFSYTPGLAVPSPGLTEVL